MVANIDYKNVVGVDGWPKSEWTGRRESENVDIVSEFK